MIQVYLPGNTNYTSNGDMVIFPESAVVTAELNGAWALNLTHPIDDEGRWESLIDSAVLKVPSFNGYQLFRIRTKGKSDTEGIICECDPIFYDAANDCFLEDVRPTQKNGQQALDIMTAANTKYSGESNISVINTAYFEFKNLLEAISGDSENTFLNRWGGEIEYNNFTIRINTRIGADHGYCFRYGRNIEGINEYVDITEVCTRIYPKAFNGRTITSGNKYADSPLINSYPTVKARTITFENIKYKDDLVEEDLNDSSLTICNTLADLDSALRQACVYQWDAGIDKPSVTVEIDGVVPDLKDFEGASLFLGDTVYLKHPVLDITSTSRIVALTYDCIREEVISVTLGKVAYNYFDQVSSAVTRIETAVRPDGSVRGEAVTGIVDMKKANLYAQYDAAEQQDVLGILFENNDSTSQLYGAMAIGTQGFMIADSKDENGDWIWSTWGTAKGLNADYIVAGTITASLIAAHSIGVSKLSGTIANGDWELDLDDGTFTIGDISANNINGGTLTLGGLNNTNGVMQVLDASGNVIGKWNKDGIAINDGIISTSGGYSYWDLANGRFVSKTAAGTGIEIQGSEIRFYVQNTLVGSISPSHYGNSDVLRIVLPSNGAMMVEDCYLVETGSLFKSYKIGNPRKAACLAMISTDGSFDDYALIGYGWGDNPTTATYIMAVDGEIIIHTDKIRLNGHSISPAPVLELTTPTFNSLSKTFYHSAITANHRLPEGGGIRLSNPAAQTSDWQITTGDGYLTISGSISGSTVAYITLVEPVITATLSSTAS